MAGVPCITETGSANDIILELWIFGIGDWIVYWQSIEHQWVRSHDIRLNVQCNTWYRFDIMYYTQKSKYFLSKYWRLFYQIWFFEYLFIVRDLFINKRFIRRQYFEKYRKKKTISSSLCVHKKINYLCVWVTINCDKVKVTAKHRLQISNHKFINEAIILTIQ